MEFRNLLRNLSKCIVTTRPVQLFYEIYRLPLIFPRVGRFETLTTALN